jgi:type II secretory ATPase GspE/PulE/Tfp pilus assembly ATPase PilB-like protein
MLYTPVGCEKCNRSGYKGRMAIHELLIASDEIKRMILRKQRVEEIRDAAMAEGMNTLLQDGIQKVLEGRTDAKSVYAAANR